MMFYYHSFGATQHCMHKSKFAFQRLLTFTKSDAMSNYVTPEIFLSCSDRSYLLIQSNTEI